MEKRTNESPMDFQWQQGHGPSSADSPFLKNTNHHQQLNSFAGQKRPFDQYETPTKPSLPSLRDPASQTFLFPSTPSMKPPVPFRNPSFTTPQRSLEIDFSSGPENESSPIAADNDETPEHRQRSGLSQTNGAMVQFAATKLDKKPLSFTTSGRGEIPRNKFYTDIIPRRVQKRRRRDADKQVRLAQQGPNYDSDSDSRPSSREGGSSRPGKQQAPIVQVPQIGFIPSFFTFIEKHPNLPHILSYYAQFLLNTFLVFFLMYLVYSFWSTIRSDVDLRSREVATETLAEMAACAREYKENRCDRSSRVPAMETVCENWEKCMKQDPTKVGRAKVSAYTFAEILNNFVEPISIKTMIVSFSLIFGCFALSNMTLMFFRSKIPAPSINAPPPPPPPPPHPSQGAYYSMQPHQFQQQQPPYPPQPYFTAYQTPFHHNMQPITAHTDDGGTERASGRDDSPTRLRIGYR